MNLILGNCLEKMKEMQICSVDAIVTDPPYGLSFMGKKWDYDVPSVEIWKEAFRVLRPGGHILSFGGTRTYHRMVVNIEDAGFEIRDQVQWIYGSGFPKSYDVSKGIDKQAAPILKCKCPHANGQRVEGPHREVCREKPKRQIIGFKDYSAPDIRGNSYDQSHVAERERLGVAITAPATDEAKQWQGWGTALKPANEPIVLARKPLDKGLTVAENVLKWGTGAINVDGCRIGFVNEKDAKEGRSSRPSKTSNANEYALNHGGLEGFDRSNRDHIQGRWPANVLFDETAAEMLDEQTGDLGKSTGGNSTNIGKNISFQTDYSGSDKKGKPIKLLEYLIKLITPPNGTILDPFMGSGSTGVAAKNLGFNFIGIEMNEEYFEIAQKRINGLTGITP